MKALGIEIEVSHDDHGTQIYSLVDIPDSGERNYSYEITGDKVTIQAYLKPELTDSATPEQLWSIYYEGKLLAFSLSAIEKCMTILRSTNSNEALDRLKSSGIFDQINSSRMT